MNYLRNMVFSLTILSFFDTISARRFTAARSINFFDSSSTLQFEVDTTFDNQSGTRWGGITGTFKNLQNKASVIGNPIYFRNGIYSDGTYEVLMTATYDPSLTNSIRLNGSGAYFYQTKPGFIKERITVNGSGNLIQGLTKFRDFQAIQFSGATAGLTLSLENELNTTMQLQSIVDLAADLILGDGIIIDGPGTINYNTFNLVLGQKDLTWSHTLRMNSAKNLILNSDNKLKAEWIFNGDAHIVGNGFILDLTGGATIRVRPNTTVRMTDLIIKGLGSGRIALDNTTSKIELHNVIFDMDGNFSVTNGAWVAEGETTAVTRNFFLTFDRRGTLTIDRTTVYYNTLNFNDKNNIRLGSLTANIAQPNGGSVRKIRSLPLGDFRISQAKELDRELVISPLKRLIFDESATIDGAGFDYRFSRNPGQTVFFIEPSVSAQFTNILLKDFPVDYVSQHSTAQLIFSDSSTVELGENGTLNDVWMFEGASILNGGGKTLTLGPSAGLVIRPNSSLLIDNIILKDISGNKIRTMDMCSTVSFGNIVMKFDSDYTMTQGRFEVVGLCELQGTYTFGYQSACSSKVRTRGTLFIDNEMTFSYAPPIANRDLIQFDDDLAFLVLRGGTLASTATGMRLTRGTFDVEGRSYMTQNSSQQHALSESIAIGDGVPSHEVFPIIGAGAVLEILSGQLFYDQEE